MFQFFSQHPGHSLDNPSGSRWRKTRNVFRVTSVHNYEFYTAGFYLHLHSYALKNKMVQRFYNCNHSWCGSRKPFNAEMVIYAGDTDSLFVLKKICNCKKMYLSSFWLVFLSSTIQRQTGTSEVLLNMSSNLNF